MLKNLFGGGKKSAKEEEYTIDDLIVLERYEEAEERLKHRIKLHRNDLHAHLKLAEVYIQLRSIARALEEYVFVAEEYAADGFHDKGIALLSKVSKLVPQDEDLPKKIEKIRRAKRMERARELAMEGLREGMSEGDTSRAGTSALELQRLWGKLVRSSVVQKLDGEQLKQLFSAMTLQRHPPSTILAEKGSQDSQLFLVVDGLVEAVAVLKAGEPATQLLTFSSGDIVGEGALLQQQSWPAVYRVAETATVLRLDRPGLERALQGNPDPRHLLETLRDQENDRQVKQTLNKLAS